MTAGKNTIDRFLDAFDGKEIDTFDAKKIICIVKAISDKIPANGEYDPAIVGDRIGEYVYAIQECGKILASLGLVCSYQETVVEKEQAMAALVRGPQNGYTTAGEKKLYAQMDEGYIKEKNKLNEINAVIAYIENYRVSFDKAHLHLKKILDRDKVEIRSVNDHERYSLANKEASWVDPDSLK